MTTEIEWRALGRLWRGEEGGAGHFGGQGNFVWSNCGLSLGSKWNRPGDGRGSFRFHEAFAPPD